ncbi:Uncharacterised protein [Mycobacteroides abscessus]|uniref:hypothetical protein n=1 Tax=Mycobacteroides abscessus TaxID=36809 RepID=UPI0005E08FAE|nr:hypothetical protein [Mycobacteroides abscessus]CPX20557.1 Uncharacterised protein [Mycobacteroides abscessus]CRG61211.1 Uncharacterised protein [Mycobacteroides abscessus]
MTTNHAHRALTAASAFILTLTATAVTFALVTATPREPRTVIQADLPVSTSQTLAEQYAEAWDHIKTEEPTP